MIELDPAVWRNAAYRKANPGRDPEKPCLYVGMTGLDPRERLADHRVGHKANRYARRYGIALRPDLYDGLNPMSYREAQRMEVVLARSLREDGFGVWQH